MPNIIIYICSAIIALGAAPMPYGYYTLVRLLACGVFVYFAILAKDAQHKYLPWICAFTAILFNPIFKVHFEKEIWSIIDILSAILLIYVGKKLSR